MGFGQGCVWVLGVIPLDRIDEIQLAGLHRTCFAKFNNRPLIDVPRVWILEYVKPYRIHIRFVPYHSGGADQ